MVYLNLINLYRVIKDWFNKTLERNSNYIIYQSLHRMDLKFHNRKRINK